MWRVACESCGKVRDCVMVAGLILCRVCGSKVERTVTEDLHARWLLEGLAGSDLSPGSGVRSDA